MFDWRFDRIQSMVLSRHHDVSVSNKKTQFTKKTELNILETYKRIITMKCNQRQKEASAYSGEKQLQM